MLNKFFRPDATQALQISMVWQYLCVLLTGVLLARSGIPLSIIGTYEMFVLAAHTFTFFWLSGAIKSIMAEKPVNDKAHLGQLIGRFQWFLLVPALLSVSVLFIAVTQYEGLAEIRPYLYLLLLYAALYTLSGLVEYLFFLEKKVAHLLRYSFSIYTLQMLAVALPFYLGLGLREALLGLIIVHGLRLLISLILLGMRNALMPDLASFRPLIYLMLPFCAYALLGGIMKYVDGFLVIHFFNQDDLAIFRYGARELPLVVILSAALSTALMPLWNQDKVQALAEIKLRSTRLMHWFYPLSGLLMLVSYYVFPLVFSPDFRESAAIFNIYLLLITSRLLFPQVMVMAGKHYRVFLPVSLLEVLINIVLSIWWLQWFGLKGLAMATVVAYFFEKAVLALWLYRKEGVPLSAYLHTKAWILYSIFLFATYIFVEWAIA